MGNYIKHINNRIISDDIKTTKYSRFYKVVCISWVSDNDIF